MQVVALVTDGAQRPDVPAVEDLPGPGNFGGYPEYIMLMEQCWHQDPAARPTFTQVTLSFCRAAAAAPAPAANVCCCGCTKVPCFRRMY